MASLSAGNRVRIQSRDMTAEDEKTGLYYSYFAGLTGTVDVVYEDGSVCIDIDLDSLNQEARDRHLAMQESERKKWLEGLSGEARNRLTPEQKQLKLSYKILVAKGDILAETGGKPAPAKRSARSEPAADDDSSAASHRTSEEELAKAEEEYLRSLQEKQE